MIRPLETVSRRPPWPLLALGVVLLTARAARGNQVPVNQVPANHVPVNQVPVNQRPGGHQVAVNVLSASHQHRSAHQVTNSQVPSIVVLYSQSSSSHSALQSPATSPRQNLVSDASRNPKHDAVVAPQTAVRTEGDVLRRGLSPPPRCAGDQPFCLYDQEYPQERVHDILNTYHDDANTLYHALHRYNPQELINRDNQTHNYRHRGHFTCESEVAYLRPGWAKNWKDQWVAVVNTDKFPQLVRVETCKFLNQKCEFLAPCYKSACVQRYAATRLLCVDPANPHQRPIIDVFEMPVACSCFVENFRFL